MKGRKITFFFVKTLERKTKLHKLKKHIECRYCEFPHIFLSPPLHRHHPLFTFIILQDSFISSNVKKRFCYGIFRTICIYIIYLGSQFGWNRNSFSLTCHVFNSNNKREKFKKIIIIFMVFYSFLFPIFSLFYDTPNQHRSELARFKRAKYARKKVSPWKPFRIFSRKSLLTSRVTAFLVE